MNGKWLWSSFCTRGLDLVQNLIRDKESGGGICIFSEIIVHIRSYNIAGGLYVFSRCDSDGKNVDGKDGDSVDDGEDGDDVDGGDDENDDYGSGDGWSAIFFLKTFLPHNT